MADTANQKQERAKRARTFLDELIERYPQCFTRDREAMRPLAIGIQKPLRQDLDNDNSVEEVPGWLVRQALALYTRSPAYLEATIAGRNRVSLDGSDAGAVTDEARRYAEERRAEQKRLQAARKPRPKRAVKPKRPSADELRQRKLEALANKFNNR
ncbi:ProP effector [Natronocella acetinitrilica]|uniref:ProP effector n=1 Tax=Natronocella acetinitrilica TaxID=414046 RepID=A0AAE3G6F3_9GAMM|nr:ProQ/FINO family protein [Natronocella acetinitrilica]MCP1676620.1 ProP effector [Natronocella acetinitrilica]